MSTTETTQTERPARWSRKWWLHESIATAAAAFGAGVLALVPPSIAGILHAPTDVVTGCAVPAITSGAVFVVAFTIAVGIGADFRRRHDQVIAALFIGTFGSMAVCLLSAAGILTGWPHRIAGGASFLIFGSGVAWIIRDSEREYREMGWDRPGKSGE